MQHLPFANPIRRVRLSKTEKPGMIFPAPPLEPVDGS
jgi:hypothetical protein